MTGCPKGCNPVYFSLSHHNPTLFVTSQWGWPQSVYVIYRLLVVVYWAVWIVLSGLANGSPGWFLLPTHWCLFLLVLTAVVQAVTATLAWAGIICTQPDGGRMSWYLRAQWLLNNLTLPSSIFVTVAYWIVFWDGSQPGGVTVHTHGVNMVYGLLDLFISATPIRLQHFYQPMLYGTAQALFSAVYQNVAGQPIYEQVDWRADLQTTLLQSLGGIFIAAPVLWFILYGLYRLKLLLHVYMCNGQVGADVVKRKVIIVY